MDLVEGDKALAAGDQVCQDDETAVRGSVGDGKASALAAVRAHKEFGTTAGEVYDSFVVDGVNSIVDKIEVEIDPGPERGLRELEACLQVGMIGGRGQKDSQLSFFQVHGLTVAFGPWLVNAGSGEQSKG